MTKDEFLTIISREVDTLESELKDVESGLQYTIDCGATKDEIDKLSYRKSVINQKLTAIKDLVNYPVYVRIQAMNDDEVNKYKEDKNKEFDLKIQEITSKIKIEENYIEECKIQEKAFMRGYSSLSDEDKADVLNKGKEIKRNIDYSEKKIISLKSELNNFEQQKNTFNDMSSEQVKSYISSKIKGSSLYDSYQKNEIDSIDKLISHIGQNYDSLLQLQNLLTKYNDVNFKEKFYIIDKKHEICDYNKMPRCLFYKFDDFIHRIGFMGDDKNLEELKQFYSSLNGNFTIEENDVLEQITDEKMLMLFDNGFNLRGNEHLLDLHSDKFDDDKADEIRSIISQVSSLEKKLIKTQKVRSEIRRLEYALIDESQNFKEKVGDWYISFIHKLEFFSIPTSLLCSRYEYKENSNKLDGYVNDLRNGFDFVKEGILTQARINDEAVKKYYPEKLDIVREIAGLVGVDPKDINMECILKKNIVKPDTCSKIIANVYRDDIVRKVEEEGNNQIVTGVSSGLDIPEEDQKGFSYSELMKVVGSLSTDDDVEVLDSGSKHL